MNKRHPAKCAKRFKILKRKAVQTVSRLHCESKYYILF